MKKHVDSTECELSIFNFDETQNYEKSDFSNHRFEDVHCEQLHRTSFRRTDFSHSTFKGCSFVGSLFDRADFINVLVIDTCFIDSDFGNALFENCIFRNVDFSGNAYTHAHFRGCHFEECSFSDEKWCIEFDNCDFLSCTLSRIKNIRSVISRLTFLDVTFRDVDIAECHAEDLVFKKCNCEKLTLDSERWLSFYYVDSKIDGVELKYHGEPVSIKEERHGIERLWKTGRYFESLNYLLIRRMAFSSEPIETTTPDNDASLAFSTKRCVEASMRQQAPQRRWNLEHIFKLLKIFYGYPVIPFEEYIVTVQFLTEIPWLKIGIEDDALEEFLEYDAWATALLKHVQCFDFNNRMLSSINPNSKCVLLIKTHAENKDEFISQLETILDAINEKKLDGLYKQPLYIELSAEPGCWLIAGTIFLLLAALFCRFLVAFGQPVLNFVTQSSVQFTLKNRMKELIASGQMDEPIKEMLEHSLNEKIRLTSEDTSDEEARVISELSREITKLQISEIALDLLSTLGNG